MTATPDMRAAGAPVPDPEPGRAGACDPGALRPDLIALPWPQRLRQADAERMTSVDLARCLGVTPRAVFRARRAEVDPAFAAAMYPKAKTRKRKINPRTAHLDTMTPEQRADYDMLLRKGYRKAEALAVLGLPAGTA